MHSSSILWLTAYGLCVEITASTSRAMLPRSTGQFFEKFALVEVGGQLADQFAILSSMSSFSSLALSSFIG
jgi:hypothetical protein